MKRIFSAMFAALLFAALPLQADDKKKDDAKSDHKRIQGKWKMVERHSNGKVQKEFDREFVIQITKGEIVLKLQGREFKQEYKLDPAKNPKHMDRTSQRNGQTRTMKCIYSLEGDTLKISRKQGERPTKFEAKEGSSQFITVFKRVKEKDN